MSKMIRWFKDRKRARKSLSTRKQEDDYGFRKSEGKKQTSDYGFNRYFISGPTMGLESPYHIYEEINDLPDLSLSAELSNMSLHSERNLHRRHSMNEGPYMIVPICDYVSETNSNQCSCSAFEKDINFSNRMETQSPLCSCMQKSDSVGRFTCVCRHQSNSSSNGDYHDPWDSSNSSGNSLLHAISDQDLSYFKTTPIDNEQCDKNVSGIKSETTTLNRNSRQYMHSTATSEADETDTGCEYDMSTSGGESDLDYNSSLQKVEQNLVLSHQVRNILRSLSTDETSQNRSDVECDTSVSGRSSSTRTGNTDTDMFADQSESDDSSGYYGSTEDNKYLPNLRNYKIKSCEKDTSVDGTDMKELILLPTRASKSRVNKSKSKLKKSFKNSNHSESKLKIKEDTELYLLPSNKRVSECGDFRVYRQPLLPQSGPIYQDVYKSRMNGGGNRLLNDVIRMNYDRQHMIPV